jgi:hypothetical protein
MYAKAGVRAKERAFQVETHNQRRMYSGGRPSSFNSGGGNTAQANQQAARRLIQQYTPVVLGMAVLGVALVLMSRRGQPPRVPTTRPGVSPRDWRLVIGSTFCLIGISVLVVGVVMLETFSAKVATATRRDQQDLESRTMRNVPSPNGRRMTVTYGPLQPQRTIEATAAQAANEPIAKLLLLCGGVALTFGLAYNIYAFVRKPNRRRLPSATESEADGPTHRP